MARLSVGKAWEEAVIFVRREAYLMLPVALLFLALPVAIVGQMLPADLLTTMSSANGKPPPLPASFLLAVLIMFLLLQTGALALLALALKPGISVAEALHLAARRLPVQIVAWLLLFAGMFIVATFAAILAAVIGMAGSAAAGTALAILILMPIVICVGIRLTLLNAVVADRGLGPVASLQASWELTAGHFWRLFAFFLLSLVVQQVLSLIFASLFGIAGGLVGGQTVAALLSGLAGALVTAAVQVYVLTMVARLYRQAEA